MSSYTTTYEKIANLMSKYDEQSENLDMLLHRVEEDDSLSVDIYSLEKRRKRTHQKLRKQMAKYLRETDNV